MDPRDPTEDSGFHDAALLGLLGRQAGVAAIVIDRTGRLRSVGRPLSTRLAGEAGDRVLSLVHEAEADALSDAIDAAFQGRTTAVELRLRARDGWIDVEGPVGPYDVGGERLVAFALTDVSARRERERKAIAETGWFQAVAAHARDVVHVLRRDAQGHWRAAFVADSLRGLLGWEPADFARLTVEEAAHSDDISVIRRTVRQVAAHPGAHARVEFRAKHRDGGYRHLESLLVNRIDDPVVAGIVITSRDVSERRLFDGLTGLPNRAMLAARLAERLGEADPCAVVALKFPRLDLVSAGLGPDQADELLRSLAHRIRSVVRGADTVARVGSDRFDVLLSELRDPAEATAFASRLLATLRDPFLAAGRQVVLLPWIGICVTSIESTVERSLADAEAALHNAARGAPGEVAVHAESMSDAIRRRLDIENALHDAIERGELSVALQPIHALPSRKVIGHEVLLRWDGGRHGVIKPEDFVPLAEESGLIVPIGRWVLREACRLAAALPDLGRLHVNVSAVQLARGDLVDDVLAALRATRLPATRLGIELTETALIDGEDAARSVLAELRALGVQVAIDDFGTGYSSLAYLRRFAIDCVKIDRSFVADLGKSKDARGLVAAIVAMSRALDIETVAEGVEHEEQLTALHELGCGAAQGFLFGRPWDPRRAKE